MANPKKLTIQDICELLGIKSSTWTAYVSRGQAPRADGWDPPRSGTPAAVPWWWETTIKDFQDGRVGPGRADGRYREG